MIKRVFFLLFYCMNIFALEAIFEASENKSWLEGDTREARIVFWPTSELNISKIKYLVEGKYFSDHFYISKVFQADYSKNNPEAYVVDVRVTLIQELRGAKSFKWKYINKLINVRYKGPVTVAEKSPLKDVVFIPKKLLSISSNTIYYALGILVFFLVCIFLFKKYHKYKEEKKKLMELQGWRKSILEFSNRDELEEVYQTRHKWKEFFDIENEEVELLLKKINQIQYKKDVSDSEIEDVRKYANRVRVFNDVHK